MKIVLVYEKPDHCSEEIHEISQYAEFIAVDGIILKLNKNKCEIHKEIDSEYYNNLSVEDKFKNFIIPQFNAGKRKFIKVFEFEKFSKVVLSDTIIFDDDEILSLDEVKKLLAEKPELESNSVKMFFKYYEND